MNPAVALIVLIIIVNIFKSLSKAAKQNRGNGSAEAPEKPVQRMPALDDIFLQRNLLLKILTARIVVSPVNLYLPFTHVRIPRIPVSAHVYE